MRNIAAHRFVVNLRSETASDGFRNALDPKQYLVPGNATPGVRQRAIALAAEGVETYADNGYFDDIGRIAAELSREGARLFRQVDARRQALGRDIRPGELAVELRDSYRALASRARAAGRLATSSRAQTLALQRALAPTRLIGAEDISMALWLALNIEPAYVAFSRRTLRRISEAVARTARLELAGLPLAEARGYYAVASAVDYNSAFDAGKAFASNGLTRVAIGFGTYMADDNSSDHVFIGRSRLDLPARMPNRYLRTAVVARGFWDGYRAAADSVPAAFHFLGLGAPIMLGVTALAGWGTKLLTFDATSPIRDAVEGTLYLSKPAPLKVRTRRVAQQLASGERDEWSCPCPFCGPFAKAHPFDYDAGHAWHRDHPGKEPGAPDLRAGGALFEAFPLLSEPAPGQLRTEVNFTRMGHNHWALATIVTRLNAASATRTRLRSHVGGVVASYERATAAPRFGAAVRFAFELADRGAEALVK